MAFNIKSLFSLPFSLLIPILVIAFFSISKKKTSFDSVFMGFGAFLASIVGAFAVYFVLNATFFTGVTFTDETSGAALINTILVALVIVVFIICESFKISAIKKLSSDEKKKSEYSALGFAAGVIIAQSLAIMVILIADGKNLTAAGAMVSGLIVLFTGIIYTILSVSAESIIKEGFKYPAYGLSSLYYIMWIMFIFLLKSTVMMYAVAVLFFILSAVIGGSLLLKSKNISFSGGKK